MSNVVYFYEKKQLNELVSAIFQIEEIGLDVEATSLDVFSAVWLTMQLALDDKTYVLDIRKLDKDLVKYIIALIKDSKKLLIGHNIKYDTQIIFTNTGESLDNVYDTMVSEVLINQGMGKQFYSLNALVEKYLGISLDKDTRKTFIDFDGELTNEQIYYAAGDVQYLKKIKDRQVGILKEQKQLTTLEIEMLNTPVASALELNGILLDVEHWKALVVENQEKLDKERDILLKLVLDKTKFKRYNSTYELANAYAIPVRTKKLKLELESLTEKDKMAEWFIANFNIGSWQQVLAMLNLSGVPAKSTNEKELQSYVGKNKIVDSLFQYREYYKRITTYGENMLAERNNVTGRYHYNYNQVGTATGRYSVSRLQQIPREQKYRRGFIARANYKILSSDYSQQEYRLAGALTQDRSIIDAYISGIDMHTLTASIAYKVSVKEVLPEQRQIAKSINFALLYDSTVYGLAYNLGISITEAEELWETLRKEYPTFIEYREHAKLLIWKNKFATTPLGRKRFFETKTFTNPDLYVWYKRKVMREGWNHMVQGWGADITKIAMNTIYHTSSFDSDYFYFYNQAHDEIDLEILVDKKDDIIPFVEKSMLDAEQPQLKEIPAAIDYRLLDYWSK